jgi:[acyl-carrier-protein] S-malonyltransferase
MITALMFPGQGSQVVGMGQDIAAAYPEAQAVFDQADAVLGFALSTLCFAGPEADLNMTINTQPAVYTVGVALLRVLQARRLDVQASMLAGHSFGEITALVAANALAFDDGLRLARARGRVMAAAGERQPGAMAALLGLEIEAVEDLCAQARAQTNGVLVVANDNCPGQVVISGDEPTLDAALDLAQALPVRKVVRLAVSIASHSPLMAVAADEFRAILAETPFSAPDVPVYGNLSAAPLADVDAIRTELGNQLTGSVRWTESMQAMIAAGAERFIELGPKDVLGSLLKRIDRTPQRLTLDSAAALQSFLDS